MCEHGSPTKRPGVGRLRPVRTTLNEAHVSSSSANSSNGLHSAKHDGQAHKMHMQQNR